jgi:adenylate cyclase
VVFAGLTGADEEGTLECLKAVRREVIDPKIAGHHGRIVKTTRGVDRGPAGEPAL